MKFKILIVYSNYYKNISQGLLTGAIKTIIQDAKITKIEVPGVFEIPVMISKNIKKFDGFIALVKQESKMFPPMIGDTPIIFATFTSG